MRCNLFIARGGGAENTTTKNFVIQESATNSHIYWLQTELNAFPLIIV